MQVPEAFPRETSPKRRTSSGDRLPSVNLRFDLAYDGAPFRGFARQPGERTIQGDLEDALSKVFHGDVTTVAAGRTDAGVHAS